MNFTPVQEGDIVNVEAFVYKTGNTSLDVYVTVERERPIESKEPEETTTALFTMVAIDENGNPVETEDVVRGTEECNRMCDRIPRDLK